MIRHLNLPRKRTEDSLGAWMFDSTKITLLWRAVLFKTINGKLKKTNIFHFYESCEVRFCYKGYTNSNRLGIK